ncbi:hypothetical protein EUX98_g2390 [Antrodiella citrinella]|uniref:lytic cellulose monooxygenase (C4-dehydrogenating) n=1 Tax=Antrodiella citrinella TaxID=2447956 RepID=A0A4S4N1D0_9APHY|nr:hypothetical protein EUX98_g2390 [Antrodiella citrinella]
MIAAFLPLLAILLSAADSVNAHGYVQNVTASGQTYPGWLPFSDPYLASPPVTVVRHVPSDGPILDETSNNLACNVDGTQGTGKVAIITAGSPITFNWTVWPADHLGPVSTYMASCNGDCSKLDLNATKVQWFKIDAAGYDSSKKQWASTVLINNGNSWTSTIPASLTDGQYLVRNEMYYCSSRRRAPQYYPSCTQVQVTGGGNANPTGSDLVSIPGIYNDVTFPDIWLDSFNSFTIPGPPLFSSKPPANAGPSPSASSAAPASSSVPSSSVISTPAPSSSSIASSPVTAPTPPSPTSSGRCRTNSRRSEKLARRHVGFSKRHH